MRQADGAGRRLKFVVYEPIQAAYYEGFIRSRKHLREVLGLYGQDMIDMVNYFKLLIVSGDFYLFV